jgi:hypothetical protein
MSISNNLDISAADTNIASLPNEITNNNLNTNHENLITTKMLLLRILNPLLLSLATT